MRRFLTNSLNTIKSKNKTYLPLFLAIVFLFVSMAVVYASVVDVTIIDGESVTAVKTLKTDPAEILAENNISVTSNDQVSFDNYEINIKRAKSIQFVVGGQSTFISSCNDTVADAILDAHIEIYPGDKISVPLDTKLQDNMQVVISRIVEKTETKTEKIDFQTKNVATSDLAEGETRVKTEGQPGELSKEFDVVYKDGVEFERNLVSETTTKEPVTKVVEYGKKAAVKASGGTSAKTASAATVSRGGSVSQMSYKKVITCSATAYTLNQGSSGNTASGMKARYGVIAVDPRVIPLGTRLYIESTDGSFVYGTAVAGDVGGAIKGNTVDLFFNSVQECNRFGRRTVNVYILE